jgi:chorismate dehydratase
MPSLRVATVPYVNAAPLVWGFRTGAVRDRIDLIGEPPARIPDRLRQGTVDVGLIPVIEYQRLSDVSFLPSLCVAARRRARSVYLACRRPMEEVRRIAVDESSRTSAALLRVVLAHRRLTGITFTEQAPDLPAMLRRADAALLIGDPALTSSTEGLEVYDLAAEWFAMTGLPFVFAAWAVRPGAFLPDGARPFADSLLHGLERIDDIARECGARLGLPEASIADYLRRNIHYQLGPEERQSLELFFRRAHDLALIPPPRPLQFLEVEVAATGSTGRVAS